MNKYLLILLAIITFSCQQEKKTNHNAPKSQAVERQIPKPKKAPTFVMNDMIASSSIEIKAADTININSLAEIVEHADHNRALKLKPGKYNLDKNLVYYITNEKKEIIDKRAVQTRSLGGQIYISGLTNFSILGGGSFISSDNPKAPLLYIIDTNKGTFKGFTLKHDSNVREKVIAPSIYVSGSKELSFTECTLGQNSIGGIKLLNTKKLAFSDCKIIGTRENIIEVTKSNTIVFDNMILTDNKCKFGCFNFWGTENSIDFKNSVFKNNTSIAKTSSRARTFFNGPHLNIKFDKCSIQNNSNFTELGLPELKLTESSIQAF